MPELYQIPINKETADMIASPSRFKDIYAIAGYILKNQYLSSIIPAGREAVLEMDSAYMYDYLRNKLIEYIKGKNDLSKTIYVDNGYLHSVAIKIPTWEEFLKFLPDIPTHREGQTRIKLEPPSYMYELGGVYAGKRTDGKSGIWVGSEHLKNIDGSLMSIAGFQEITSTLYAEMKKKEPYDWCETAAMYCVMRNQAKYLKRENEEKIIIKQLKKEARGWRDTDLRKKLKFDNTEPYATDKRENRDANAIRGVITAITNPKVDFSNGAYFWDGADITSIEKNEHSREWGIYYTDPAHDIYKMKRNTMTKDTKNEYDPVYENGRIIGHRYEIRGKFNKPIKGRYQDAEDIHSSDKTKRTAIFTHKLDSTAAYGGTIFWKYCPIFRRIAGQRDYP